jgi:hypothetical protein
MTFRDREALRRIVKRLEPEMQCNCDLDNWQPEPTTGHSWVCRIHQLAIARHKNAEKDPE